MVRIDLKTNHFFIYKPKVFMPVVDIIYRLDIREGEI